MKVRWYRVLGVHSEHHIKDVKWYSSECQLSGEIQWTMPGMGNLEHMDVSNLPVPTKHTLAENGWHMFPPFKGRKQPKA